MPVRRIPKSYRSVTGLVASNKLQRMAEFESSLERDLILLIEFDLNVNYYEEQPLVINYVDSDGQEHSYTPDIFVKYRNDIAPAKWMLPSLYEVKYRQDLFANWKELKPKYRAARAYAKAKGWKFYIITEQEIRTPYLQNAKFLLPYRRLSFDWSEQEFLLGRLKDMRETNPEALMLACYKEPTNRAKLIPIMWHLVSISMIGVDLRLPLTMHSTIWSLD